MKTGRTREYDKGDPLGRTIRVQCCEKKVHQSGGLGERGEGGAVGPESPNELNFRTGCGKRQYAPAQSGGIRIDGSMKSARRSCTFTNEGLNGKGKSGKIGIFVAY